MKRCRWTGGAIPFLFLLVPACREDRGGEKPPSSGATAADASIVETAGAAVGGDRFSLAGPGPRPADNSLCFVCHQGLSKELITTAHSTENILCVDCHGRSTLHMEDEMLMTQPDVLYGRNEVEDLCRRCHGPHKDPVKVEQFREEWYGRDRANGRVVNMRSICTDCHGEHNLAGKVAKAEKTTVAEEGQWINLFNGTDLKGWRTKGKDGWSAGSGGIKGLAASGAADLLSQEEYGDFLLAVTYQVEWPCAAGIWLRHRSGGQGYRVEIVEQEAPELYSGTLVIPGGEPLVVNRDRQLVDREGWNTISVKAQGGHIEVFLNGHEIGQVDDRSFAAGQIGFHVRPVPGQQTGAIIIGEVRLQPLEGDGS